MKTAAERVDEILGGGMDWVGREICIELIERAVAVEREQCQARAASANKNWAEVVSHAQQAGYVDGVVKERARCAAEVQNYLNPRAGIQLSRRPGECLRAILAAIECGG